MGWFNNDSWSQNINPETLSSSTKKQQIWIETEERVEEKKRDRREMGTQMLRQNNNRAQ